MMSSVEHMHHFVCLKCRRSVKGVLRTASYYIENRHVCVALPEKCSQCGGEMPCMGKHFTPPRRHDETQWRKLEYLISQGWPHANWQTTPEMSVRDVRETQPKRIEGGEKRLLIVKNHRAVEKQLQKTQRHKTRKARQKKRRVQKEWAAQCQYQEQISAQLKND